MFRFAHPIFLYLLLLIPVLTAAYIFIRIRQKQKLKKFGNINLIHQLTVGVSHFRRNLKFFLLMLAFDSANQARDGNGNCRYTCLFCHSEQ